jgi:hypothetical protein
MNTEKTAREWVAIVGIEVPESQGIQAARAVRIGEPTTYREAWELAMHSLRTMPNALSATVQRRPNTA